tara:strand:+ start:105 stop:338 length:234 start_codon:yes stop_codon:yes gene_type:complete
MKGNKKMTTNNRHNETNEVLKKINDKNNLINEIDVLFYDIENIEKQASVFRAILRQQKKVFLDALKDFIIEDVKGGK